MTTDQARDVLSRYRPGDTNQLDEQLVEALELARQDSELAAWFGLYCANQAAHAPALPETPRRPATLPPKPPKPAQTSAKREFVFPHRPVVLIILATLLGIGAYVYSARVRPVQQNTFGSFRDRMARSVQRTYPVKMLASDQADIREYFRTNSGPTVAELPQKLESLSGVGGAVFTWHGQPVSLLALQDGGTNLYLFVISHTIFEDSPTATPQFMRVGQVMTAGWSDRTNVYLLTGPDNLDALRSYTE